MAGCPVKKKWPARKKNATSKARPKPPLPLTSHSKRNNQPSNYDERALHNVQVRMNFTRHNTCLLV